MRAAITKVKDVWSGRLAQVDKLSRLIWKPGFDGFTSGWSPPSQQEEVGHLHTLAVSEKIMKRFLIWLVRLYQRFISPLFPPSCRYRPACSTTWFKRRNMEAKVFWWIIARILRCHPFVEGGEDPVPDHFSLKKFRQKLVLLFFMKVL